MKSIVDLFSFCLRSLGFRWTRTGRKENFLSSNIVLVSNLCLFFPKLVRVYYVYRAFGIETEINMFSKLISSLNNNNVLWTKSRTTFYCGINMHLVSCIIFVMNGNSVRDKYMFWISRTKLEIIFNFYSWKFEENAVFMNFIWYICDSQ